MFIIILHLIQRYGAVANRSVLRYHQAWRSIFHKKLPNKAKGLPALDFVWQCRLKH